MAAPGLPDNFKQPLLTTTPAAVPPPSSWAAETPTGTGSTGGGSGSGTTTASARRPVVLPSSSARHYSDDNGDVDSSPDGGEARNLVIAEEFSLPRHGRPGDEAEAYELQDYAVADDVPMMAKSHRHYPGGDYDTVEMGDYGADGLGSDDSSQRLSASASTAPDFQLYTPDEEQAVVRKFDRRLVLFLSGCYLLSFLDRSNIGNARLAGMERDLQTRPPRDEWFAWSLTSFYIAYIVFEWMSLLFKLIPAHIYISILVMSWGITASLQSVAVSYPVLIFLRVLLGIGEAGFTGVPFYLSFFFKRDELALRTALFISAAPLATTFASSLAWLILKVGETLPIAPWRVLFLLEGFPSVVIGAIAWSVIPDRPQTAPYLTEREKKVARLRLRHDKPKTRKAGKLERQQSNLKPREILSVFADPTAWIMALIFFLTNMAYSSMPVFLPTILEEMGHTAVESQALSAPPYLIAFLSILATANLSDKLKTRAPFIIGHALFSALGYSVLALARPLHIGPLLRYLAIYPAATGFFNVVVLIISWSINNQPTESRQGGGFALLQLIGQCGPIVGTRLYPKKDQPYFEPGMWACAGAMFGVAVLTVLLRWYLARENRKRSDTGDAEEAQGLVGGAPGREIVAFKYML